jgi:phosphoribosylaminoimidazole-succinocarboxamide synthase
MHEQLLTSHLNRLLSSTLVDTHFSWCGERYQGKVRDTYRVGKRRYLVTTDRLSAFDRHLTTLPAKGCLIQALAVHSFRRAESVVPSHLIEVIDPCVMVAENARVIPIEVVVRQYLAGGAWRAYAKGEMVSGITLPPGLREFSKLPVPLITPSTKAPQGAHDQPLSEEEILQRGLLLPNQWEQIKEYALALFALGTEMAAEQGLLLVDTKYEFGFVGDTIKIVDEIHTLDSSRYWRKGTYEQRFKDGLPPEMLDKEPIRRFLLEKKFMGDGEVPPFSNEDRIRFSQLYCEAFEEITGSSAVDLIKDINDRDPHHRIEEVLRKATSAPSV